MICVVKMRGSDHAKQLWLYEIGPDGLRIGATLEAHEGLLTGTPHRRDG